MAGQMFLRIAISVYVFPLFLRETAKLLSASAVSESNVITHLRLMRNQ